MKILLVNSNTFKQPWPVMPFGLCCVAAACKEAGHKAEVLDMCFSKDYTKDINRSIGIFFPDVVGIGIRNIDNATALNIRFFLDDIKENIVSPCKDAFSGPIIIGGPAVGISGAEMLGFFDLEYAVRGDGEAAIVEFLNRLAAAADMDGLRGLIIRRGGRIAQDLPPLYVDDLDSLPVPNPGDFIDIRRYIRSDSPIQIQTKRGCALKCVYCTYNTIEGPAYRLKSPGLIAGQIERLVRETGINHVEFTDSTFNIPLEHAKEVLRAVIAKKMSLRLRTMGLNPGAIDDELVSLMKEAGFEDVDLGAETLCDTTLNGLGKNYKAKDVFEAARLLHREKIAVLWYILLGAPGETEETVKETLASVVSAALQWDLINVGVGIRAYKGAPIVSGLCGKNITHTGDGFLRPCIFEPENISIKKIKTIVKETSFKRHNIYMYDEDEITPERLLWLAHLLTRLFARGKPLWRMFIVIRRIEAALGIRRIRERLWKRREKRK